jgi:hypothetical protein
MIFLVGVQSYESLGHLYEGYEQLFQTATVVTLTTFEPQFGTLKISAEDMSGLSELTTQILLALEVQVTEANATNLLAAIESKTDRLQSFSTTADTFQLVAELLRRGARRKRVATATIQPSAQFSQALAVPKKANGIVPKKKKGGLDHQPSESSVGGRG